MKEGPFIKKILYSSWFLALLPAGLIMFFLHPLGSKYKMSVEPAEKPYVNCIFCDLNSDSISEMLVTGRVTPYYYVAVRDIDNRIYDQWNLADSVKPGISEVFFGNYDHDRFREIYIFTFRRDSLFLNLNEILDPAGTKMERIFITKVGYLNGEIAAVVMPAGFYDETGDGKDELYFSISSSFRLGTRRMYYFDLVSMTLKSSQFCGSICLDPVMADVDNDRIPEIFGNMSASGNYKSNVPYSDSSTWLMVFNDRLSFKFPPVQFRGFANSLTTLPYRNGKLRGYVLSHLANGTDTTVLKSGVMIYTKEGKLVRYRQYDQFIKSRNPILFVVRSNPTDRIYLIGNKFFELNDSLNVIRTLDIPFSSTVYPFLADVNGDGADEFLLYSEYEKKLALYNSDFRLLTILTFSTPDNIWKFYPCLSKDLGYRLFLSSEHKGYFLRLNMNNYYILSLFAYPGLYAAIFFFIVLIKRIGRYQLHVKESLNKRLLVLQLQGIKAQLDPHFTFNTLNSIASLIYLEDRQAAYDYMLKFTQLLRSMLNDAEKIYRNLEDELNFVTTYLDLEKMRFGKKFKYSIEIGEGVNKRDLVPKLVLQTFAENAVKHGIMPSEKGGIIGIRVIREKDYLKLTIEDNGVGREFSSGQSNSTGKGLKLASEFYEILNQINKKPIKFRITDLYNNLHEPEGTRVEVWVPENETLLELKN